MNENFHIAVAANERYMIGALVALSGVAAFAKPGAHLHFHVFTEDVRDETMTWMRDTLLRLHANSVVEQHVCDESILSGLPYWAGSRMASVRCFFPYILKNVDWCLYLDCDILYLASVEEHFSYRDDSAYAVVVREEHSETRKIECAWARKMCGTDIPDADYFNSGVMLFNFKKCREDKMPEKIHQFFKDHPDVRLPDQTAMNVVFCGRTVLAPPKFDRLQIFLTDDKLTEHPVIHYVSGNPWVNKFNEVASGRFRLWHMFADKYIYHWKGTSYKKQFSRKVLFSKYLAYWVFKIPVLRYLFLFVLRCVGFQGATPEWMKEQVEFDCSVSAIRKVLS